MVTIDPIATGRNIKFLRDKNHLTNADIQSAFGFAAPQAIYKWYRGDSLPTVDNLVILAELFHVRIDDILIVNKTSELQAA